MSLIILLYKKKAFILKLNTFQFTSETPAGTQPPTGRGGHLTLLHAGTKDGFIPNTELIIQAKNERDYHKHKFYGTGGSWRFDQLQFKLSPIRP